ncbi:MAG: DUF4340 domain-containing protein [Nitrospinota bacterium]
MDKCAKEALLNFLKTFILFILLLAAAFYAYNSIYIGEQKKAEREKAEKKLLDFKAGDLVKISVRGGGGDFTMEKRGEEWLITSPIETKTDSSQLDELMRAIAEGHIIEKVGGADDRARFGLDPAQWEFEFYTATGSSPQRLAVGNLSPTGKLIYVTSSRRDGVVAMDSGFGHRVRKPMFYLREKRLFDADSDEIVKLELVRGDYRLAAEKGKNGRWELVVPFKAMADGKKVGELIRKIVYLRAAGFPSGKVRDEVTGLVSAERIRLWRSGNENPLVLSIGGKSSNGEMLWVRSSKKDTIANVDAGFLNSVPADAQGLREMRIVPLDDAFWEKLKELTVKSGGKTLSVVKNGSGEWKPSKPSSFKPDGEKIAELLSYLGAMKSTRFVSGSKAQVDKADLEIGLKSGEQKVAVAFVKGVTKKGILGGSNLYDENFVVSNQDFDILDTRISDLEDRRLFPFKEKDVVSLFINREGKKYIFTKETSGWKSVVPSGKDVDGKKLDALVRYMTRMEFIGRLKETDESAFTTPLAVVTISGRQSTMERSITILGYNKEKTFLTAKSEDNEGLLKISSGLEEVISSKGLEGLFR